MNVELKKIDFAAPVEILAAKDETKTPTFSMVAYTGGTMRVAGYYDPVALSLKGMSFDDSTPIRFQHDENKGVGHTTTVSIVSNQLHASGVISRDTSWARDVINSSKQGFPWKASIGAYPTKMEWYGEGETVNVNGKEVEGPVYVAWESRLGEISFVDIPADKDTSATIAAMEGNNNMSKVDTPNTAAIVAAKKEERERIQEIDNLCANMEGVEHLRAQAIEGTLSVPQLSAKLLEKVRASRPVGPHIATGAKVPVSDSKAIEAAMLMRLGHGKVAEAKLGEYACDGGEQMRHMHVLAMCEMALKAAGQDVPLSKTEIIRASFSTTAMPTALGNSAQKIALDIYESAPASWRSFCQKVPVNDFHKHDIVRPSFARPLEQIGSHGEVKHDVAKEETADIEAETYAKQIGISRRDLINDNLHVFDQAAIAFGNAAIRKQSDLVYSVILTDDGTFFNSDNDNYITGADTALAIAGLDLAIKKFRSRRDADGNDLDIAPAVLVVPPALEAEARRIADSISIQWTGGTDGDAVVARSTGNHLRNVITVEVEQRLANTVKWASASDDAWFLFGAPQTAPVVVALLNGVESPTVEFFGMDTDPNVLGVAWRVYMDFGAGFCDYRAVVKSKGTV